MTRGSWGWVLAAGAVVFTQAGVDPQQDAARVDGPSQGQIPVASPAGGGGGGAEVQAPDYGPLILRIDGGNRHGVDAVGGSSPTPAGGGGGGGAASVPGADPDAPTQIGPWFLRFDPPVDRRNGTGPGGSPEPTLAPGSPAPRR